MNKHTYCVVAAINDDLTLSQNLAASPLLAEGIELKTMRGYSSAAKAYNNGLDTTDAEIIIFAHQDIYFPSHWKRHLEAAIQRIELINPNWAVLGVYGVSPIGDHIGHCWSTGLGRVLGEPFGDPQPVCSVDEIVIILRKASGIRFDNALPGFHLYGTDIVQTALSLGHGAYVIHGPVVHNSKPVRSLAGPYSRAYNYMQAKWHDRLPIKTTVVPITKYGYPLLRQRIRKALLRKQASIARDALSGPAIAAEVAFD